MTIISDDNRFEWDSDKNKKNKVKHGLSFEQILPIFDDPFFLEVYDKEHSLENEDRFFGLGSVNGIVVVAASYTEKMRTRIISARLGSSKEKEFYDEFCKKADC